jgi:pimeloyl-ACP methyl ester carboxylesterase
MKSPHLVLLHGYPLDHTLWYGVIASLGSGVRVLAPDLPGFGGTPISGKEPTMETMANSVLEALDRLEIPKAVMAGMSMGGYVALAFAELFPSRLAGLGLISTQSQADTDEARSNRHKLIEKIRAQGISAAVEAIQPKMFAPAKAQNADFLRFPAEGAAKAGADGLIWALEAMARRPDRTEALRKLALPTIVIHGSEDQIIPLDRAKQMCEALPNASLVQIKGAGHCTPVEAPEAVAQSLRGLVEGCTRQP